MQINTGSNNNVARVVIEPDDIKDNHLGVEIQVKGFRGSTEELDEENTHIYVETYNGEARIMIWSDDDEPRVFTLKKSNEIKEI